MIGKRKLKELGTENILEGTKLCDEVFHETRGSHLNKPETWKKKLKQDGLLLGYYDKKQLVGFLLAHKKPPIGRYHLSLIGVKNEYRGKRIAKRMMKRFEKIAKKRKYKYVTVNVFGKRAPRMYKYLYKLGYRLTKNENHIWKPTGEKIVKSFFRKDL